MLKKEAIYLGRTQCAKLELNASFSDSVGIGRTQCAKQVPIY